MSKSETPELDAQSPFEVAREDSRGKFLLLSDNSNFPKWYKYYFHTPVKDRIADKKLRAPYNKAVMTLVVYADPKGNDKNTSYSQYVDMDDFLLICDKVCRLARVPQGEKIEIISLIGFSEKSQTARQMSIVAQPNMKDPNKVSFMISFKKGTGTPSPSGTGFTWGPEVKNNFIVLDGDSLKKYCLSGQAHFQATRTACLTRCYSDLYPDMFETKTTK